MYHCGFECLSIRFRSSNPRIICSSMNIIATCREKLVKESVDMVAEAAASGLRKSILYIVWIVSDESMLFPIQPSCTSRKPILVPASNSSPPPRTTVSPVFNSPRHLLSRHSGKSNRYPHHRQHLVQIERRHQTYRYQYPLSKDR